MPPIINARTITKRFGAMPLFEDVSLTVSEGDRIGLVGPNGSGKSTLLRILAGEIEPDSGEVATRKRTKLAYVEQHSEFVAGDTVRSVIERALERALVPPEEHEGRLVESLGKAGFVSWQTAREQLSSRDSSATAGSSISPGLPRLQLSRGDAAAPDTSARAGMPEPHQPGKSHTSERESDDRAAAAEASETFSIQATSLSGGWRKRLAIVEALVQQPDVLLLDEPTNHLDLEGIEWLEDLLEQSSFACVAVSHDRYFLENVATEMMELSRAYPQGLLLVPGNYTAFLEKKEEFLHAQARHQEALENRVRREIEWLQRGAKARTRKAKARIDKANELISELGDINARTRTSTADIDFSATERKTKRLIELEGVAYRLPSGRELFRGLNFVLTAGKRVGLVGPNGSGKTTLLRLLRGELSVSAGEIRRSEFLRVVYFDQNRPLKPDITLRRALAPESDSVVYQDRVIHVAGWASRFLFTSEQLNQPVGRLSGGERARVLMAQLMLQPADVLLLDEPTNDLDIPTLEILEESLLEFSGALVMVTHDRYMLDRISSVVLGLDGEADAGVFADYAQWENWMQERQPGSRAKAQVKDGGDRRAEGRLHPARGKSSADSSSGAARQLPSAQKKLSYMEAREYSTIEQRIAEAEELLEKQKAAAEDPAIASDAPRLVEAHARLEQAQKNVDELYARWAELEGRLG